MIQGNTSRGKNSLTWDILIFRSYAPYSEKQEACIIVGRTGTYYPGVRVENVSFPLTIDAVQAAIFSCLSEKDTPSELLLPELNQYAHTSKADHDKAVESGKHQHTDPVSCSSDSVAFWCRQFDISCRTVASLEEINRNRFFQTAERQLNTDRLTKLTSRCIIPYSSFPVTALLSTDNGIYSGVNIEMADWQKGLCAERTAMAKALASGAGKFKEIHVYAPQSDYVSPCGACRQVLLEHMSNASMLLHHNEDETSRLTVSDLLPYQFKAQNLTRNKKN